MAAKDPAIFSRIFSPAAAAAADADVLLLNLQNRPFQDGFLELNLSHGFFYESVKICCECTSKRCMILLELG